VTVTDGDADADGDADGDADEVLGLGDADGETLGLVLGVGVALADEVLELGDADGESRGQEQGRRPEGRSHDGREQHCLKHEALPPTVPCARSSRPHTIPGQGQQMLTNRTGLAEKEREGGLAASIARRRRSGITASTRPSWTLAVPSAIPLAGSRAGRVAGQAHLGESEVGAQRPPRRQATIGFPSGWRIPSSFGQK
jgi:hypothetical protein